MSLSKLDLQLFKDDYHEIVDKYRASTLSFDELNTWKKNKLQNVLKHVKKGSPFYAEKLKHINPDEINQNNLSKLPFTTKDDLRDEMFDILSAPLDQAAFYYETTGTTGAATPCPRDKKESYASNLQLQFAYEDIIKNYFPESKKPVLGIMGPTEVHSFSDTLESIAFELDICSAKIWPGSPVIGFDKCINLIKDLGIEIIATSPGQVMALAKEIKKRGLDPKKDFDVKAFMLSGELCTPALAENLASLWDAKIFNSLYGSQEAFVIASSTPNNKLRPHLPNYIFEIVDPATGLGLGDSGIGELVVTSLIDGVKPLIRYRTGDIVHLHDNSSSNLYERYELEVVGRVRDAVNLNGSNFTAAEIEQVIMESVHNCFGYQIIITNSSGKDTLIVKYEIHNLPAEERKALLKAISERVYSVLGCECSLMIIDDLSEHVNLGGWIKWKAARLVDTRSTVTSDEGETTTQKLLERLNS
ncbi:phenylacetate--CoA ligase family protein [Acinetobacter venetianus]|uniref:phenylacetate--CoA ligase family protein n=1 Tax=Acinetobacter venetianus TaxID=52133 RepID=UPI0007782C03|nr:phenylacetate--CoA ligase family protein [Acinetobacter venetianus]KXZ66159.1 Phenylacetate-coenzyme A ligase [Acinetobacter venetianus]